MSSFDRRTVLISLLALAGCGFEPVYGTAGNGNALRGTILADAPKTRDEYAVVARLEERLGRGERAVYGLRVVLDTEEEGLAISGSNDITRYNLSGRARFALRELATDEVVFSDSVNSFTAYSASQQPVATLAAERDARARLMYALADKITSRLLLNSRNFAP